MKALIMGAWAIAVTLMFSAIWRSAIDFHVYRDAARYVLSGGQDVYGTSFSVGLPFTYPPFALLLFLPLGVTDGVVGLLLLRFTGLLAFAAVCWAVLRSTPSPRHTSQGWWLLLVTGLVVTSPVRETLEKGQINLLILAVCVLALVKLSGFWSGFLIGMAGGVKLTPLALGLVHLRQRDWAAVAGIAAGLATSVGLGFLAFPRATSEFWTSTVLTPGRVGNVSYPANASMRGVLDRLFADQGTATGLWVGLSLLVVVAGYTLIPRAPGRAERMTGVGVAATVMLLISPISWTHHWVWFPVLAIAWLRATSPLGTLPRRMTRGLWLLSGLMLMVGPLEIVNMAGLDVTELAWPAVAIGSWIPVTATLALLETAGFRFIERRRQSAPG